MLNLKSLPLINPNSTVCIAWFPNNLMVITSLKAGSTFLRSLAHEKRNGFVVLYSFKNNFIVDNLKNPQKLSEVDILKKINYFTSGAKLPKSHTLAVFIRDPYKKIYSGLYERIKGKHRKITKEGVIERLNLVNLSEDPVDYHVNIYHYIIIDLLPQLDLKNTIIVDLDKENDKKREFFTNNFLNIKEATIDAALHSNKEYRSTIKRWLEPNDTFFKNYINTLIQLDVAAYKAINFFYKDLIYNYEHRE